MARTRFFPRRLAFRERIQTGGDIHVDFYLLSAFAEFSDVSNPLSRFPKFAELIDAAADFNTKHCSIEAVGKHKFSRFRFKQTKTGARLDTRAVLKLINAESGKRRHALFENYSAFNRGPHRSVIALMMMNDLRDGRWRPGWPSKQRGGPARLGLRRYPIRGNLVLVIAAPQRVFRLQSR